MITALLICLTILGKLTALAKEIVFASLFGVGSETDAYFVANQLPGVLWLAIYTTIPSVFMPMYIRALSNPDSAAKIANEAIRYYMIVAVLMTAFCWAFTGTIVSLVAPSVDSFTHDRAVELTRIMALGFILTGYVGVQSAIQQSNRKFAPPLAVPVINNMLALAAIYIAFLFGNVAIAVVGAVGAYVVQAAIQRYQTLGFYKTRLGIKIRSATWQRLSLLSLPMIFAVVLDQANILIGTAIASGFGTGAISHLNYATRLSLFVAGLFSWLVSYLFFPALAANAARDDDLANAAVLTRSIALIAVATAPMAAGALALRSDVVNLIYGRGAFGPDDVQTTATLFGILGLSVMFVALRELLNRIYFSYQKTIAPLLIGIVAAAVNVVSSLILSRIFGIWGVAAGTVLAALTFCLGQVGILALWKPDLLEKRLAVYFFASLLAGTAAYFAVQTVYPSLFHWHILFRFVFSGAMVAIVYAPVLGGLLFISGVSPSAAIVQLYGRPVGFLKWVR